MERIRNRSFQKFGSRVLPGGDLYQQEQSFFQMALRREDTHVTNWLSTLSIPVYTLDGRRSLEDLLEEACKTIETGIFNVSEEAIIKAIRTNHLTTVEDVTHFTKAGGACGKCKGEIQKILEKVNGANQAPQAKPKTYEQMTLVEKIKAIEKVLEEDVRPKLNLDGGSVELVDLNGTTVQVRLTGMCSGCAGAQGTLKNFIEKVLQDRLSKNLTVEQA